MQRLVTTILGTALLAGCHAPAEGDRAANESAPAAAAPVPPAPPSPPVPPPPGASKAVSVEEETNAFTFAYSYPAEAAGIAPLDAWLRQDRDSLRAKLVADTEEARREAQKDGFEYRPYDSSTHWAVVTETPRLLSLSAEFYEYSGGAHGNPGTRALLWDKTAGRRLAPIDVFTSAAALQQAIGAPFCRAIDAERAKRRGEPVVRSDDPFTACPKVEEATLILGSTDRRAIDRLGLLVGPYVAGPYAEGSYEVTLPVTPAVLGAVKPEWREAFALRK